MLRCDVFYLHTRIWLSLFIYSVSQKNPPPTPDVFWHFPKRLGIFSQKFTRLLYVPIYARLQIFIQLSAALSKLMPY